jgi:hypothetical protein
MFCRKIGQDPGIFFAMHIVLHQFELGPKRPGFLAYVGRALDNGFAPRRDHLLGKPPHPNRSGPGHNALIGLDRTQDYSKKGRFSGSVGTYEADSIARIHVQGHLAEKILFADEF